jgi:hypothetical protein
MCDVKAAEKILVPQEWQSPMKEDEGWTPSIMGLFCHPDLLYKQSAFLKTSCYVKWGIIYLNHSLVSIYASLQQAAKPTLVDKNTVEHP